MRGLFTSGVEENLSGKVFRSGRLRRKLVQPVGKDDLLGRLPTWLHDSSPGSRTWTLMVR